MRRGSFRQFFVLMLGLLVVMGMSFSVGEASNMAAGMTISGETMSGSMDHCSSCKVNSDGAKMMTCGATCVAPMNATVPQFDVLLVELPVDHPVSQSPTLSGWTASPNPHPPKLIALI